MVNVTDLFDDILESAKNAIQDDAKIPLEIDVVFALGRNEGGKTVAFAFDRYFPGNVFRFENTAEEVADEIRDVIVKLSKLKTP